MNWRKNMKRTITLLLCVLVILYFGACAKSYQAKPLPFKAPSSFPNAANLAGATIGVKAFVEPKEAKEAFGFDIREAGLLPVEVAFDHQGAKTLEINPAQTFLEDQEGNLWPILTSDLAYERVTKYAQTKQIFKEGAYHGFLGAAAGAFIGAAIGIVGGDNVASSAGKGAAVGAAAGATLGGAKGYASDDARRKVINDLNQKSLQNKKIEPNGLTFGFIFFPGEARSAKTLRLQLIEVGTENKYLAQFNLQ
jgi:hypothetical protein